jgi:hypothetical protein
LRELQDPGPGKIISPIYTLCPKWEGSPASSLNLDLRTF